MFSFEEPSYAVMEGEAVRVCAVITSGMSAVPVAIDINTAGGTAESKESLDLSCMSSWFCTHRY